MNFTIKATTLLIMGLISFSGQAQLGGLKNKIKQKASEVTSKPSSSSNSGSNSDNNSNTNSSNTVESTESKKPSLFSASSAGSSMENGMRVITAEELNNEPYSEEDRLLKTEDGGMGIVKGIYKKDFTDRIDFSGFYYLNSYAIVAPANHFSSDTTKFYGGFSIEYSPDEHNMQVHWENGVSNYAMVPEQYEESADKGNVMFQFGMQGGPESYYNAECLVLEPGVILIGAYVYHKNDEVGHQWMNDAQPQSFVIAAKDTTKFKEYQNEPEYTSKVVFEKFDALRRVWKEKEIKEARPLPAEGMTDAKLKSESFALIKKTAEAYQWKETVQYSYITSTDWETRVSLLTGKPLTRSIKCIVVMKTPDGNYKREGFYIGQKYTGTGWGSTHMLYNDQLIYYVNPADAMKYK